MTCKSSKSAVINWLQPAFVALLMASSAHAQQASPSPSPLPAQGYVRFWNMVPGKDAPALQLLYGDKKVLATAPGSNYGASYQVLPASTYTFVIQRIGDVDNPLKKQAVVLRGDTYITFLVSQQNGQPTVELIDDTLDPKSADNPARLVIRQFMLDAKVTVSTKTGTTSQPVGYGESATLEGLPNQTMSLVMKATGLGPEPKLWSAEADFTVARHATLLVVADPYGRFRPRIAYDGWNGAMPTPKPAPSARP